MSEHELRKLEDIKGQDISRLRSYVTGRNKKPLLIYGPSGTGKTSSIYAIANDLGYEVVEINASDCRNKEAITSIVGNAINQMSLAGRGKIILIDEIDGLSGNNDRGGMKAFIDIAEESRFPIIATMTDTEKLNEIQKNFVLLEYKKLNDKDIYCILEGICKSSKICYNEKDLSKMSMIANGDVRKAIINLRISTVDNEVKRENVELLVGLSKDNMDDALVKVFKSRNFGVVMKALFELENNIVDTTKVGVRPVLFDNEECFIYAVEENMPYEYNNEALLNGFELLSKADRFHRRIFTWQHYRYLVYIQSLLASVCLAKAGKNPAAIEYRKTSRSPKNNKKLWWLVNRKKASIAEKIAMHANMSNKKAIKDFGYYKIILRNNPIKELSDEEIEYLNS